MMMTATLDEDLDDEIAKDGTLRLFSLVNSP